MFLITTIKGTVRLMSDDEMFMEDLALGIYDVHRFMTKQQQEELYNYAKTTITDKQEDKIRELAGQ